MDGNRLAADLEGRSAGIAETGRYLHDATSKSKVTSRGASLVHHGTVTVLYSACRLQPVAQALGVESSYGVHRYFSL